MKTNLRSLILCALLTLSVASSASAEGPSPDVPQLAALRNLVGTFETQYDAPAKTKGTAKGAWIHEGRFVQQTWSREATTTAPAINGTIIITYDVARKTYRQWSFDSTGTVFESDGNWDPDSRTMTWRGNSPGFSHTWKQTFDKQRAHTWSIVITDKSGNTVYETSGKTTPTGSRK